jgi:BirA family transcriptional regulator, biotin operon repressor / biotin---[acetyl-CoA-carboxylase] ligase
MAETLPSDITPECILRRLTTRIVGRELRVQAVLGSTNDAAMAAGSDGAPEGLCILADRQESGRGRSGRAWCSKGGVGLYTSVLLRPELPAHRLSCLTLLAGLAVLEAIRAVSPLQPRLKWPNDILLDGRKTAGILAEMATEGSRVSRLVIGIGLNVNHQPEDFPPEVRPLATSLAQSLGRTLDRGEVAAALYTALDRWYQRFLATGPDDVVAAARRETATLGRPVTVLADGAAWNGVALDLDGDGALLVRDAGGAVRRVLADDVSIR